MNDPTSTDREPLRRLNRHHGTVKQPGLSKRQANASLALLLLLIPLNQQVIAQATQWWSVTGPASWNNEDHWENRQSVLNSGIPDAAFAEQAGFDNDGTAEVTADAVMPIAGLHILRGQVHIGPGGELQVSDLDGVRGVTTVASEGSLRIAGDGRLETGALTSTGSIELMSDVAQLEVRDDFSSSGNLTLMISADGNAQIAVGGTAELAGTISPIFEERIPALGESFPFLSGATTIVSQGATLELPASMPLPRGFGLRLTSSDGSAAIHVDNAPILSVDRISGATQMLNVVGSPLPMTGYSIFSDNELLSTEGWVPLAQQDDRWQIANPRVDAIAEVNLLGNTKLEVGGPTLQLGNVYRAGNVHPTEEDLRFEISLVDGSVIDGTVEYVGPPNDLTLRVDPLTGAAEISHQSSFMNAIDVTGYRIQSAGGSLQTSDWNTFDESFGEDWTVTDRTSQMLSESSPSTSVLFDNGTEFSLGSIFDVTQPRDLIFEYSTLTGQNAFIGTVEYGPLGGLADPLDCNQDGVVSASDFACSNAVGTTSLLLETLRLLPGDLDGQGGVAFADFLVLSEHFGQAVGRYDRGDIDGDGAVGFSDFLVLSLNFGQSATAARAIPEPASWVFASLSLVLVPGWLRHRRAKQPGDA